MDKIIVVRHLPEEFDKLSIIANGKHGQTTHSMVLSSLRRLCYNEKLEKKDIAPKKVRMFIRVNGDIYPKALCAANKKGLSLSDYIIRYITNPLLDKKDGNDIV